MEIEITTTIKIGDKIITLTLEEAKELRDRLNRFLVADVLLDKKLPKHYNPPQWIPYLQPSPTPHQPDKLPWLEPKIWCSVHQDPTYSSEFK